MNITLIFLAFYTPFSQAQEKSPEFKKEMRALIKQVPTKVTVFNVMPATSEARKWLTIMDHNDFSHAWEQASILVRQSITKEAFIKEASRSREPLGSFIKRDILIAQPKTEMPGAPQGQYVLITFKSEFHNKQPVNETIIVQKDPDNSWRVAGYFAL